MASRHRDSKHPVGSALWAAWMETQAAGGRRPAHTPADAGGLFLNRAELTRQAEEAAAGPLRQARGKAVGYALANGADWLRTFLALQRVGAAAAPLDAGAPEAGRRSAAADLGFDAWWDGQRLHELRGRRARRLYPDAAVIKVTSGSTGQPQAVPCRARHMLADGRQIIATMKIRPHDRNLALLPLGHSYGLGNLVMPLILQGTSMVTAEAFMPGQVPEWIARHGITVLPTVPAVLRVLAHLPGSGTLGPLRLVISAGARLPAEVAAQFEARFGLKVHNFYGSSETGGICYDRAGTASRTGRAVGTPMAGVAVQVRRDGRIRVKSAAVAVGRGAHTLPDIGTFNRRGELVITGRTGTVANIGGRKVAPLEIEAALRAIPGVRDAWVTVVARNGQDAVAAAVESEDPEREIRRRLGEKLAPWKWPRLWTCMPELPRTGRGKLDTAALRRRWEE